MRVNVKSRISAPCDIERSEPTGSPALRRGMGWWAFNLPLRIFILGGGADDHAH